jgi:hypothetical protein
MNCALSFLPIPGAWVEVDCGAYRHVGIVSDRLDASGWPCVISCSRRAGRVIEEPWLAFSGGRAVRLLGLHGSLHPMRVVANARAGIGQAYDLFIWNCEHFVRWASGLPPESPQVQGYLILGTVGTALFVVARLNRSGSWTA